MENIRDIWQQQTLEISKYFDYSTMLTLYSLLHSWYFSIKIQRKLIVGNKDTNKQNSIIYQKMYGSVIQNQNSRKLSYLNHEIHQN